MSFLQQVQQLMDTVRQMDHALKRRPKVAQPSSFAASGSAYMTDSEKIRKQVHAARCSRIRRRRWLGINKHIYLYLWKQLKGVGGVVTIRNKELDACSINAATYIYAYIHV